VIEFVLYLLTALVVIFNCLVNSTFVVIVGY